MDRQRAATKLTIPTSVRPSVPRPRLVERLDHDGYRVALVSAPAGFGKTSLLATWAQSRRDSTAWMSCSPSDADPMRFWAGLFAAVGTRWPGVGDDASVLLERGSVESEDLAASLANDLAEARAPMVIVVDDVHLAARTPATLGSLVSVLPDNVRLVLGSRLDPVLPLGRLRVAGSLLELHTGDLCFTPAETAAALEINGVATDPHNVSTLHELTEGWPAGVQLATLAIGRSSNHKQFLDAFASTDRAVAEFLVDEVLNALDPELVEFLHETSVLEVFDAALCEAVTGRADAGVLLDRLVANNLFVVRLDVGNGWYRYHHLFGAFLRARLRSFGVVRWSETHDRAAMALEARGDTLGALLQATTGGNPQLSSAIVRRMIERMINVVDPHRSTSVVRSWLEAYGRQQVISDPGHVLELLLVPVATLNPDDSVWWFGQIEQAHPDLDPQTMIKLQGVWAEHHLARGQPEEALPRVQRAMSAALGVPLTGVNSAAPMVLARAHLQARDLEAATAVLTALERTPTGHPVVDIVRLPSLQAWIAWENAELHQAEQRARRAVASADQLGLAPSELGRIFADITLAAVALERLEDGTAIDRLAAARHGADMGGRPPLQSIVALQQAAAARVGGEEESAAANLHLARLFLPAASRSVRFTFDHEAALQAMAFRPSDAAAIISELGDDPAATLLRIRLALADGDRRTAARLIEQLPPATSLRDRVVRTSLVAVTTADRDLDGAVATFTEALTEAQTQGLMRSVIDLAPDVSRLLMAVTPRQGLAPYVSALIDAVHVVPAARTRTVTSLVEQLSEREVTVLRYLCSRLTYQEIASALYVSLNTLKSHVKAVYRKLGVASRQEAVEAGRQLRII